MSKGSLEGFLVAAKWEYTCKHRVLKKWQVGTGHVIRAVLSSRADKAHAGQWSVKSQRYFTNVKNVERTIDSYMLQMN